MVQKGRLVIGILFLAAAVFMWTEVDKLSPSAKRAVDGCNQGWGDFMGTWGQNQCIKMQLIYYSPWILGVIGTIILVKSHSNYYGSRSRKYY